MSRRRAAREARHVLEFALGPDVRTWRWSLGASRVIDLWLTIEEAGE